MIKFNNLSQQPPYLVFKEKYELAINAGQNNIEAISISSYNKLNNEVDSRYVNIKFIDKEKFIFFSNYNSPKSIAFASHEQIAGLFYWPKINLQIRMKAIIKKTSTEFNNKYFAQRPPDKNALAISSHQSEKITSYDDVMTKWIKAKENMDLSQCPSYWGGFSLTPYYFEFWEGESSRINSRIVFQKNLESWENFIIQP